MPWMLGIDEAGYGPNLGPFVMSAVACQVTDADVDLWQRLAAIVRRGGRADDRIHVDDSKVVYSSGKGLSGLERGVFAVFGWPCFTLGDLVTHLCQSGTHELGGESWYAGTSALPVDADMTELECLQKRFVLASSEVNVSRWMAHSLVVCPARFNALTARAGTKSAVLAHGFVQLLADAVAATQGDSLHVHVDKQGGRNTYAAQVQQALPGGMVLAVEEGALRSVYRVVGLGREITLTFQPRADGEWMCVALASMVSKYLRELFMHEFNGFWQTHIPGLKPTAGYPGDAPRFLDAIRPAADKLNIPQGAIWRER